MSRSDVLARIMAPLSTEAADLFDAADLPAMDWDDAYAVSSEALFALCEVLRHYESPAWGNTAGRYGHRGGWLDLDAVLALSEDDLTDADGNAHPSIGDHADAFMVWTFARYADAHGPSALISLADSLNTVTD